MGEHVDRYHLALIISGQSAVVEVGKGVQRRAWFSALSETSGKTSERELIRIDDPGRVGDDGVGKAVLEYGRET
jgi:hypothetical protein